MALSRGLHRPDHTDAAVVRATKLYARQGLNFTPLRQSVFEVIAESETHIGAYDILRQLAKKGRKVSPISVYRALESLVGAGVVRRLKSTSTYFPSHAVRSRNKEDGTQTVYLVCEMCNRVTETSCPPAYNAIRRASDAAMFSLAANYVEVSGVCDSCGGEKVASARTPRRREPRGHLMPCD